MLGMTTRASRGARLLVAAALAWLGLAMYAQAAHATYSKITIVKINQGGNPSDSFTFVPSVTPAASAFALKGGESKTLSVECNVGSSCIQRWGNLTQAVTESAAAGYTMTDAVCRHTQGYNGWPSEPNTSSPVDGDTSVNVAGRKMTFGLNWWEWVKCYVTNTRDTGTIKVTKSLSPTSDSGKFNLLVGGQVKASNVGNGGTTGVLTVNTGAYTVGETAGTGTNVADYSSALVCKDTAHGNAVDNDGTVQVDKGDAWECVITNTRKTGTIKVTKVLSPASDSGRFNLLVGGVVKKADVGDGGTTGVLTVNTGAYSVGETAGTGTSLADYSSSLACKDTAHGNAVDNDGTLQVGYGDAWECVITNTRKTQPPPPVAPPSPKLPAAPKIQVSPERVRTGSAKLRGPSGCPRTGTVAATVSGRRIVKVTFYVDGKKVKTLTKANGKGGTWVPPLNIKRLAYGAHRVRATVQFAKSSQTKAKTLRFSFDRCHAAAAQPKFTG
jgi:Prealbumin-like fold domain